MMIVFFFGLLFFSGFWTKDNIVSPRRSIVSIFVNFFFLFLFSKKYLVNCRHHISIECSCYSHKQITYTALSYIIHNQHSIEKMICWVLFPSYSLVLLQKDKIEKKKSVWTSKGSYQLLTWLFEKSNKVVAVLNCVFFIF